MKLYYAPGACSLAAHIVAREAGLGLDLEKVDLATRRTETGTDLLAVNPKGYVPALQLEDGSVLTEAAVVVQYLADRRPEARLAPAQGTMERYRLLEWLNFIGSEIHKGFGPLWNPATPEATKKAAIDRLGQRFGYLDRELSQRPYLLGQDFTVADAYLFTVLRWADLFGLDIARFGALRAFIARVGARPAVEQALAAEGLLKQAA